MLGDKRLNCVAWKALSLAQVCESPAGVERSIGRHQRGTCQLGAERNVRGFDVASEMGKGRTVTLLELSEATYQVIACL